MKGKLIRLPDGSLGFEYRSIFTHYESNTPSKLTHIWPISRWEIYGMGSADVESAIGKDATSIDGGVHVYIGNGVYLDGYMPQGVSTQAISIVKEPYPCPKVRKGIETRWNSTKERWEKLLRKGWEAI